MQLDDDDYLDTPSSVGEIKLVICHTSKPRKSKKKGKRKQDDTLKPALPDLEKVHERKKMGVGHRVRYVTILNNLYICITLGI